MLLSLKRFLCGHTNLSALIILLLVTIVFQSLCSIDSYFYAQCGQCDSAVFFMCGKAMMNGLVPYSDFADSKGLLLWLLYGIAYLIDNYSYIGVFWLSCVSLWITLFLSYRASLLYLDRKWSLLSSIVFVVPLVYWNFYTETKAEHFCWPFVIYSIYVLNKLLQDRTVSQKSCFFVGCSLVACLMIKWSIAIMLLGIILSLIICDFYYNKSWKVISGILGGLLVSIVPFVFYFVVVGNMNDMLLEYFSNTMKSVSVSGDKTIWVYLGEIWQLVSTKRVIYVLYILPLLVLYKRYGALGLLMFLNASFFLLLSIHHDNYGHYISIVAPFASFSIAIILSLLKKLNFNILYPCVAGSICMLYVLIGNVYYKPTFLNRTGDLDDFFAVSYAMSTIDRPKVITLMGQERGFSMGDVLPATRYWIKQMGATEEMNQSQLEAAYSGVCDFIIFRNDAEEGKYKNKISSLGYHFLVRNKVGSVYTKHDVKMPASVKHISPLEVIVKKTYKDIYKSE